MTDPAYDLPAPTWGITPAQTVGPFLAIGMPWEDGPDVVPPDTPGLLRIVGTVYDGAGDPVPDAVVETWQADPDGRFDHPDDPRGATPPSLQGFRAFGRATTETGGFEIRTVRPGPLPAGDDGSEAPHLDVLVFARGMINHVVTRMYFPDEDAANAADPVLQAVDPARRATLVAEVEGDHLRFDVRLQGAGETVFFAL